ncbi:MAG: chaperone NapD [Pseudodesulfovibrio sp.]
MAITSIILHVECAKLTSVSHAMSREPDLTVYGDHDGQYLVVVGEIPSGKLEDRIKELEESPGVLAAYTTYVNIEDEQMGESEDTLQPPAQ